MRTTSTTALAVRAAFVLACLPLCMACVCGVVAFTPGACTTGGSTGGGNNSGGGGGGGVIGGGVGTGGGGGGGASTVLLSETRSAGAPVAFANSCAGPSATFQDTFNASASKLVSLTVTGPVTNSRPQIIVTDAFSTQVANSGQTPTTQTASASFSPAGSQIFILTVEECSPGVTGNYTVLVTQAP